MIGVEATLNSFPASIIDQIMKAVWAAAMWLLRTAFELVDGVGGFRDGSAIADAAGKPSPASPFFAVWPTLLWIGGAVAVGLFLWQLTVTMIRGGAGFWRLASGPVAFSVATALTLGAVAALVGAAEGLTVLLLQRGLAADNFRTILDHPNLGFSDSPALDSPIDATARAVLLGMIAMFGVLPAALGFLLQVLFRQAVILVLVATVPITAAGLVANTTATWFWRSLRWMLAAILMKPALALVLVIGVNMLSAPTGFGGLLAGTGVLLISLFCPLVLFRLLAFVELGVGAGARTGSVFGAGAWAAIPAAGSAAEQTNVARFDAVTTGVRPDLLPAGGARTSSPAGAARLVGDDAAARLDATGVGQGRGGRAAPEGPGRASTGTASGTVLPIGGGSGPPRTRRPAGAVAGPRPAATPHSPPMSPERALRGRADAAPRPAPSPVRAVPLRPPPGGVDSAAGDRERRVP